MPDAAAVNEAQCLGLECGKITLPARGEVWDFLPGDRLRRRFGVVYGYLCETRKCAR